VIRGFRMDATISNDDNDINEHDEAAADGINGRLKAGGENAEPAWPAPGAGVNQLKATPTSRNGGVYRVCLVILPNSRMVGGFEGAVGRVRGV